MDLIDFVLYRCKFIKRYISRNHRILNDSTRSPKKNRVNLHYWEKRNSDLHNLGDWLSPIIVEYVLNARGLSLDSATDKTSHLYAIGSIIGFGYQNATIWGSGLLMEPKTKFEYKFRKLDIRCLRGPETAAALKALGFTPPPAHMVIPHYCCRYSINQI